MIKYDSLFIGKAISNLSTTELSYLITNHSHLILVLEVDAAAHLDQALGTETHLAEEGPRLVEVDISTQR